MRFIAVSNREPYIHRFAGERVECIQPASGMATALDPIMRAAGGVWVAHGSGDADRIAADRYHRVAVPPENPAYTLRRVWLDKRIEEEYYYGLANEGLWPLCHLAFQRPVFRSRDWESYRTANSIFAEAILEEAAGKPAVVFIQDYHFGLLPRMLKKRNPRLVVAQFWHIPWPNRETFRVFPWQEELLDGMLGNDLLGFHLRQDCRNFLDTVDRGLEARVDSERFSILRNGNLTHVHPFPISIDYDAHVREARSPAVQAHMQWWLAQLGSRPEFLGIGIDRADYTKGIPERLRGIDRFLELNPEFRGRLVFVQVAVPTRVSIRQYEDHLREIQSLVESINSRWATATWRPIEFYGRHFPQDELMALHRLSDFCIVSSLHDGMNLVAKEYVSSQSGGEGVLILSRFTGAAQELTAALPVNPFSPDQMAGTIRHAILMPSVERRRRMSRLTAVVRENNIYTWAAGILNTLRGLEVCDAATADPGRAEVASAATRALQRSAWSGLPAASDAAHPIFR